MLNTGGGRGEGGCVRTSRWVVCARRVRATGRPGGAVAALALTVTVVWGWAAAGALASQGIKAMWGPGTHDGVSLFPTYRELGVQLYEDKLDWSVIAQRRPLHPRDPNDPAYRWPAEVTRSVAEANKYGMQVALMLIFAPRWANGHKPPKWATFN